jgi:serine O-acetyltransferase
MAEHTMNPNFVSELMADRLSHSLAIPVREEVSRFADTLIGVLFPHFADGEFASADEIGGALLVLKGELRHALLPFEGKMDHSVADTVARFYDRLPAAYRLLRKDAEAIYAGDPAAESVDEVISAYPGFLAIAFFRIAHEFSILGVPIFPRILTEIAHQRTGIDIHPGASIGESFCIDHGTGIVIGETTSIGNSVKVYQGVTLGALSVAKGMSTTKRHPTIEDGVVIYSNATILGGTTVIGRNSVIGGNVWLTESVPAFSAVYHKSDIKVRDSRAEPLPIDYVI